MNFIAKNANTISMLTIIFRTIIIYFVLVLSIRLMGKRQIGELQVSEFIVALMLSEIAVYPITSRNSPLIHSIVTILLLLSIEVIISFILLKSNKLKRIFYGSPTILIRNGILIQSELKKNRIEIDEIMSELRQKGYSDISKIAYAILEENGKMSVFPYACIAPATPSDLGIDVQDSGLAHVCILDGTVIFSSLKLLSWDEKRLHEELLKRNLSLSDVFLMTVDDAEKINIILKEKKR